MCYMCRPSAEVGPKNKPKNWSNDVFQVARAVQYRERNMTPRAMNEIDEPIRNTRGMKATYVLAQPHQGMS